MSSIVWTLARLLAPYDVSAFVEGYLERDMLHVERQDGHYYQGLPSIADLDAILWVADPTWGEVQVANCRRGADWVDLTKGPPSTAVLRSAVDQGDSLVLNDVHRYWLPVGELVRDCEQALGMPVNANLYLTPPNAQGLSAHYDTQDGIILQLEGSKRWRCAPPVRELPLPKEDRDIDPVSVLDATEITLKAGELLYVPRGVIHEPCTLDEWSLHLTVTLNTVRWSALLSSAFQQAVSRAAAQESELRRALPVDWLRDGFSLSAIRTTFDQLARIALGYLDLEATLAVEREAHIAGMSPLPRSAFRGLSLLSGDTARPSRYVVARPCALIERDGGLDLHCPGSVLDVPSSARSVLEWMMRKETFDLGELSALTSPAVAVPLVQRLVSAGFISVTERAL